MEGQHLEIREERLRGVSVLTGADNYWPFVRWREAYAWVLTSEVITHRRSKLLCRQRVECDDSSREGRRRGQINNRLTGRPDERK